MGDPFSQAPVGFVIDRDCVWRVVLALVRGDDAAVDPVINNAFADAISFAKLTDAERIGRGHRSRDRCLWRTHLIMLSVSGLPVELW